MKITETSLLYADPAVESGIIRRAAPSTPAVEPQAVERKPSPKASKPVAGPPADAVAEFLRLAARVEQLEATVARLSAQLKAAALGGDQDKLAALVERRVLARLQGRLTE